MAQTIGIGVIGMGWMGQVHSKTIEAYNFLQSIATGEQGQPGLAEALAVAEVQAAIERSWMSDAWEGVTPID